MNCSDKPHPHAELAPGREGAVLVAEAGVAFHPPVGKASGVDPIAEWLSLMEVMHMLCPVWPVRDRPVRDRPMQGNHWLL
jgi:hypothetical protein